GLHAGEHRVRRTLATGARPAARGRRANPRAARGSRSVRAPACAGRLLRPVRAHRLGAEPGGPAGGRLGPARPHPGRVQRGRGADHVPALRPPAPESGAGGGSGGGELGGERADGTPHGGRGHRALTSSQPRPIFRTRSLRSGACTISSLKEPFTWISLAIPPVQPVWWLARMPARLPRWKYW